ncbi:NUDIX domain-containing protein [Streptomyces sp. CB01881]|uniref:NUDIX hydrolase n=1 Tax=Streptomyces sp. CB01881 TaxID=2078691 RepID=UPI000CDC82D0|nr:NUDIX domain-containing protein [Streptomyces sp. CB01881]AUY52525.1 NUDIX hydrolase [Streptomyces sp. CB01881]TYC70242.1 NUDIX domain-containing protein [Streptomyces sp. CB01881]
MTTAYEPLQRFASYGILRRPDAVLMVRIGPSSKDDHGRWMLPGGKVEHGEHPRDTVVREFKEETGFDVAAGRLLDLDAEHRLLSIGIDFHAVFALYEIEVTGGELTHGGHGGVDASAWIPFSDLAGLPILPPIRDALRRHLGPVAGLG